MKGVSTLKLLGATTISQLLRASHSAKSPFVKEIITGRCYANPPSGKTDDAPSCPDTVGRIMSVLEGHRDGDIKSTYFDDYARSASFLSPPDSALLRFDSPEKDGETFIPSSFVTPEDTPGGALLKDLIVCGVDKQDDCDVHSNAVLSFWMSAYAAFAGGIEGQLHIVVGKDFRNHENEALFRGAVMPNLKKRAISSITIFAKDCHDADDALYALAGAGFVDVTCNEDWVESFFCRHDPGESDLCRRCRAPGPPEGPEPPLPPGADANRPPTSPSTGLRDHTHSTGGSPKPSSRTDSHIFIIALSVAVLLIVAGYFAITVASSRKVMYTPIPNRKSQGSLVRRPSETSRSSAPLQ